ncbi:tripartite ATP-independent transporter solute receptor, DctP family [Noviherbaspirillum humi]|uniref:Tripartite ATP-independent transporter solute receptor, DctP family n=1 Tax=Noviherbaspirillum humi TaxID=1688639 RepID=A0A239LKQ8_9BURK|nr:TRAP transporter substrate-binding protein [Noviherbaspirillum humi]SNT30249.1 tripartite ATP-independent transporter solute receptor, DctP family [Noviherbaspirillum humi]
MTQQTRRKFLTQASKLTAGTLATSMVGKFAYGQTAEFSMKYGSNLPAVHPLNVRAKEAADAIRKETNGRVDIQVFPNNQLGSDTDMLSQVRSGAMDFMTLSGLILSTLVPVASINGIGFAFKDYQQVWAAMDGELGAFVRGNIAKAGLHAFDKIWDNGFRQITSSTKPINTPADLKGFKIRVPVSPLWTSMFKALDAAPASINFSEVYSALQTKIVEGQENPLAIIQTAKLFEVQKYCSLTNHMWDGFWFLANGKMWNRMPKDLQAIITKHINGAGERERDDVRRLNNSVEVELKSKGMAFNQVNVDAFRAVLKKSGFYADWKKKYGADAWAMLEKYAGKLE